MNYYISSCCLLISSLHHTVPQQGGLFITTEFGRMQVDPNEICVIQVSMFSFLWDSVCLVWSFVCSSFCCCCCSFGFVFVLCLSAHKEYFTENRSGTVVDMSKRISWELFLSCSFVRWSTISNNNEHSRFISGHIRVTSQGKTNNYITYIRGQYVPCFKLGDNFACSEHICSNKLSSWLPQRQVHIDCFLPCCEMSFNKKIVGE